MYSGSPITTVPQVTSGDVRKDGSVTITGDFDFGAKKITNLGEPTAAQDAATKNYVDAINNPGDFKESVRVATTVTGPLATAYENADTIDGIVLATGDRILIKNQSTGSENGIYTVNASGAPTRATDFAASDTVASSMTTVEEGTANADSTWLCTNDSGADIVGTHSLVFTQFTGTVLTYTEGVQESANVVKSDINGLTEDVSPADADFLQTWDASAGVHKKVSRANLIQNALILPRGYIDGLILSYGSGADLTFAIGAARDATDAKNIKLTTAINKEIDGNWTAGTILGGFPSTITLTASSWYHSFLIMHTDGTVDAGFDSSVTATNLLTDSGYTYYRRVGSIFVDGVFTIAEFKQIGDDFIWESGWTGFNVSDPGTADTLRVLAAVPIGVSVESKLLLIFTSTVLSDNEVDLNHPDGNPAVGFTTVIEGTGSRRNNGSVWTNTAQQIMTGFDQSDVNTTLKADVIGWRDLRGKDS